MKIPFVGNKQDQLNEAKLYQAQIQESQSRLGYQAANIPFETERDRMRDLLTYTLNNDELRRKIERNIRGRDVREYEDEQGNISFQEVVVGDPVIQDRKGQENFMIFIDPYLDKNVVMSEFTNVKEMNKFLENVGRTIQAWCKANHNRYGIDDKKINSTIFFILDQIEYTMRRSLAGAERQYGYGAVKETRHTHSSGEEENKKGSLFK